MDKQQLIDRLQEMICEAGSQQKLARQIGFSGAYISEVKQGKQEPSDRFCRALGFRRVVTKVVTFEQIENTNA